MKRLFNKTKILFFIVFILIFNLIYISCSREDKQEEALQTADQNEAVAFSEEVNQILEKKKDLVKNMAQDPLIIRFVREANQKNQALSNSDISRLDKKWQQTEGIDDFIKPFITNDTALFLVAFQDENDVFSEIFVTDKKGVIIGETNKTSDYYQADEDWWTQTYNEGKGKDFFGEIEYDESSRSEAIPIHVPILDPDSKEVIGVIKAVCDITAIKLEL